MGFPGKFDSSNVSRDNVSRRIGRMRQDVGEGVNQGMRPLRRVALPLLPRASHEEDPYCRRKLLCVKHEYET